MASWGVNVLKKIKTVLKKYARLTVELYTNIAILNLWETSAEYSINNKI